MPTASSRQFACRRPNTRRGVLPTPISSDSKRTRSPQLPAPTGLLWRNHIAACEYRPPVSSAIIRDSRPRPLVRSTSPALIAPNRMNGADFAISDADNTASFSKPGTPCVRGQTTDSQIFSRTSKLHAKLANVHLSRVASQHSLATQRFVASKLGSFTICAAQNTTVPSHLPLKLRPTSVAPLERVFDEKLITCLSCMQIGNVQ